MRKQPAVSNSRSRKRTLQDDAAASEVANTRKFEVLTQCRWIMCTNTAVPPSKYCSDDCGVRLAQCRILKVGRVPTRLFFLHLLHP